MQKRQAAEVIGTVQEQSKQYVLNGKLLRLGNNNIVCLGIARNFCSWYSKKPKAIVNLLRIELPLFYLVWQLRLKKQKEAKEVILWWLEGMKSFKLFFSNLTQQLTMHLKLTIRLCLSTLQHQYTKCAL